MILGHTCEQKLVLGGNELELTHEAAVAVLEAMALVDDHVLEVDPRECLAVAHGDLVCCNHYRHLHGALHCRRGRVYSVKVNVQANWL